jgi:hypothetical protein
MALALCTSAELKLYLDGMETPSKYDTLIDNIINSTSSRFEKFCDREFEDSESDVTEYHDGDGSIDFIVVRRPPITSITSLHDDPDRGYNADDLIASTDYTYYSTSGIVKLDGVTFLEGIKNIKIVYQGGYTTSTIPDDLNMACIMQSAFIFKMREKIGLTSISGEGGSVSVYQPMKLLPEVNDVLSTYKIHRIPV